MLGLLFSFVKNELETPILDDQFCYVSECDISVSKLLGFETFPIILMVSVSKFFGIKKSIGIGIEKSIGICFEKIWYKKSIGIGFEKFCIEKGHKYS